MAHQRITGLLLALCLNVAFIAMFVWQALPRVADVPDPSRMALVWAVPVVDSPPPALPPSPAVAPRTGPARQPAIAAEAVPVIAAPGEAIIESDAADPFDQPASETERASDKAAVARAIKVAMAERKALEDTQKFVKSAPGPTRYEQFAANVEDATIPYCFGSNPMKHVPPVLEVGSVTIPLVGLLALPFFAKAVATGKCRVK